MSLAPPRVVLGAFVAAAIVLAQLATSPVPAEADMARIIDFEENMVDCDTAQLLGPDAISTKALAGDPADVSLDALVMVDVADGARIARIADDAERAAAKQALFDSIGKSLAVGKQSYAGVDVALKYNDYALLQPLQADGTARKRTTNAQEIIDLAKQQLGGARPSDIDVVDVATDLDIQLPSLGNAVAGLADCIGGVAHPDRAFAVGEVQGDDIPIGPITFYKDLPAKIAAHEIGHLMGGHHHYQECGTAAPAAAQRGEPGPCTLMTNFVDFQTLPFSTLNGAIVRGHAEEFAAANDAPPPGARKARRKR